MAKTLEQLAKEIYNEMLAEGEEITEEESLEMARMEMGAKEIKNYVSDKTERKDRKPRERKVDNEKALLLEWLTEGLTDRDIEVTTENEVKLHFKYNNSDYSVTLTKHRAKK